mmetsp:Transcript_42907/g.127177  ORF Transcript_42907/g.127177 Transcript_42907/m.127177 type:complete len:225 (+) Transcript_42907:330-1004(+)
MDLCRAADEQILDALLAQRFQHLADIVGHAVHGDDAVPFQNLLVVAIEVPVLHRPIRHLPDDKGFALIAVVEEHAQGLPTPLQRDHELLGPPHDDIQLVLGAELCHHLADVFSDAIHLHDVVPRAQLEVARRAGVILAHEAAGAGDVFGQACDAQRAPVQGVEGDAEDPTTFQPLQRDEKLRRRPVAPVVMLIELIWQHRLCDQLTGAVRLVGAAGAEHRMAGS